MWFTNKTFFSEKWKKKENIWFRKFDMKAGENERFGWQIGQRWMALLGIYKNLMKQIVKDLVVCICVLITY